MIATLNRIAELTEPKAIATEFKKLPAKEAVCIAFQCAINWADDGDFMEQIMSALDVHRQIQDNVGFMSSLDDKKLLEGLANPFWSVDTVVWTVLRVSRYHSDRGGYKRIGAIANLALKQLEKK